MEPLRRHQCSISIFDKKRWTVVIASLFQQLRDALMYRPGFGVTQEKGDTCGNQGLICFSVLKF